MIGLDKVEEGTGLSDQRSQKHIGSGQELQVDMWVLVRMEITFIRFRSMYEGFSFYFSYLFHYATVSS